MCVIALLAIYTLKSKRLIKDGKEKVKDMNELIGTMDEVIAGQDELLEIYRDQR